MPRWNRRSRVDELQRLLALKISQETVNCLTSTMRERPSVTGVEMATTDFV